MDYDTTIKLQTPLKVTLKTTRLALSRQQERDLIIGSGTIFSTERVMAMSLRRRGLAVEGAKEQQRRDL